MNDETRLGEVRGLLSEIADMNAFCAWIREAIRAKETELNDATTKSYEDWLKENGLENDRPQPMCQGCSRPLVYIW